MAEFTKTSPVEKKKPQEEILSKTAIASLAPQKTSDVDLPGYWKKEGTTEESVGDNPYANRDEAQRSTNANVDKMGSSFFANEKKVTGAPGDYSLDKTAHYNDYMKKASPVNTPTPTETKPPVTTPSVSSEFEGLVTKPKLYGEKAPNESAYDYHMRSISDFMTDELSPEERAKRERAAAQMQLLQYFGEAARAFTNLNAVSGGAPSQTFTEPTSNKTLETWYKDKDAEKRENKKLKLSAREKDRAEYLQAYREYMARKHASDVAQQKNQYDLMKWNMTQKQKDQEKKDEYQRKVDLQKQKHDDDVELAKLRGQITKDVNRSKPQSGKTSQSYDETYVRDDDGNIIKKTRTPHSGTSRANKVKGNDGKMYDPSTLSPTMKRKLGITV